jgi:hypothetical protein
LGHCAHQRLDSLADRRSVGFLLEIGLHHLSPDTTRRSIGNDSFEAVSSFDSDVPGTRLMVLSWHHQQDQAGVPARIPWVSPGPYLPTASYRQGNFCFVTLPDGGQGDDDHFSSSSRPQALDHRLEAVLGGGVEQPGKVVDVPDRLSGK